MSDPEMGHRRWTFAAGWIPAEGTGREPEFTSRDELCLLNATARDACIRVTIVHEDQDPVGPYEILVPASRVRQVRINDLIDPQAVPLDQPYGMVVISDEPVTAQVVHYDTRSSALAVSVYSGVPG